MSVSVTLKSYFYEVLIPSSQKNTSSPIEDILHHVSISFMKKLALYKSFNPRTHTGCDLRNLRVFGSLGGFQSTHPHGVRLSYIEEVHPNDWFQSTHPHGVRLYSAYEADCNFEFQSTHPHGVRPWNFRTDIRLSIVSIHAPTRGATLPFQHMDTSACHVSIHAPTRGATGNK